MDNFIKLVQDIEKESEEIKNINVAKLNDNIDIIANYLNIGNKK